MYALKDDRTVVTWWVDGVDPDGRSSRSWSPGPDFPYTGPAVGSFGIGVDESQRIVVGSSDGRTITSYDQIGNTPGTRIWKLLVSMHGRELDILKSEK